MFRLARNLGGEKMTLFAPASQLIVKAGDTQTADAFVLASGDWFKMQNAVQAILALPSDFTEYTTRYGDASSGLLMKECFDAMHNLRQVATKYGNPKQLRAKLVKDPNFLANRDRPDNDTYSSLVWGITRAHQDAFALASYLKSIPENAQGAKPAEVVAGIKSMFLDPNGMADKMRATAMAFDAQVKELESLQNQLETAQGAMQTYTDRSSKTRLELDKEIGDLKQKITQLEKDRDDAYAKWLALTIAAVTVSAGLAIAGIALSVILAAPTAGTSLVVGSAISVGVATAVGGALGVAAGVARTSYEDLVKDLADKEDFLVKRTAYRTDLGALDSLMQFSLPASDGLLRQVRGVRDGWNSTIEEIKFRVGNLTVDDLQTGPWLKRDEMAAAAAKWTTLDTLLKSFTIGSFVDYDVIKFGDPLPKDDPNWQQNFISKIAA
jgi:hypothetical protein